MLFCFSGEGSELWLHRMALEAKKLELEDSSCHALAVWPEAGYSASLSLSCSRWKPQSPAHLPPDGWEEEGAHRPSPGSGAVPPWGSDFAGTMASETRLRGGLRKWKVISGLCAHGSRG